MTYQYDEALICDEPHRINMCAELAVQSLSTINRPMPLSERGFTEDEDVLMFLSAAEQFATLRLEAQLDAKFKLGRTKVMARAAVREWSRMTVRPMKVGVKNG
jgi:hypothetical protein